MWLGRSIPGLLANCCCQPPPGGTRGAFRGQGVKPTTCPSAERPQASSSLVAFLQLQCCFRLWLWLSRLAQPAASGHLLCAGPGPDLPLGAPDSLAPPLFPKYTCSTNCEPHSAGETKQACGPGRSPSSSEMLIIIQYGA